MQKHSNIPMPQHYSFSFQCTSIPIFQCHGIILISKAKACKYSNAMALFIQFPMQSILQNIKGSRMNKDSTNTNNPSTNQSGGTHVKK
jgi:hypothetical protein